MRCLHFYTIWALFLHLAHILQILPSTYLVALFVFVFGTIVVERNKKKMRPRNYIITHLLHLLPLAIKDKSIHFHILIISLLMYLAVFGMGRIQCIYRNIQDYQDGKNTCV